MDQTDLRNVVEQVLREMSITAVPEPVQPPGCKESGGTAPAAAQGSTEIEDGFVPDVTEIDIREQYLVKNPRHGEEYAELKLHAPCRLGIGKAGARVRTTPLLQFRAAHSVAQDAVFSDVDHEFVERMGLFTVRSQCENKDIYLTRPDLGRRLSEESVKTLKEKCKKGVQLQLFVADGLSSASVAANVADLLPSIEQGLERNGICCGDPFFVKYGRVGVMDEVSEVLDAEVTCVLIGERPGLITAESMSVYIGYRCTIGMPEARRTVVSNIHREGTNPAEAGAHVADIIKKVLDNKASGTELKI